MMMKGIILAFMILSVQLDAKLLKPWEYPLGSCVKYSEDFQKEFGGEYIWIYSSPYPNYIG